MLGQWFLRSSWCGCGCSSSSWELGSAISFPCPWNQAEQWRRSGWVWTAQNSLGAFLEGGKSPLHLLFLLLKSHILCFEAMGLVSSMCILPFWKAPRQCRAPWHGAHVAFPRELWHTRWDPRPAAPAPAPAPPSQGSSGHPSAC